jgi:hypothetical protein
MVPVENISAHFLQVSDALRFNGVHGRPEAPGRNADVANELTSKVTEVVKTDRFAGARNIDVLLSKELLGGANSSLDDRRRDRRSSALPKRVC